MDPRIPARETAVIALLSLLFLKTGLHALGVMAAAVVALDVFASARNAWRVFAARRAGARLCKAAEGSPAR